jgi:hypothetical protein
MNPLILMAIIAGVPALLIVVTRTKAVFAFMALCVGVVLSTYVGDAAMDMVQTFIRNYNTTSQAAIQIGLLLAPMLLTILFLSRTLSKSKLVINLFPAILTGVATLFLVVPLLSPGTRGAVYATSIWDQVSQYQAAFISAAALIGLAQLWASGHGAKVKDKKKSKH